ncbi:hypothetical protein ACVW1A_003629 [Bradyrhizobium sp. LB1.3]
MVQGYCLGSFHFEAPLATNNCGTFFSFMYLRMAPLVEVPSEPKISSTPSLSTSLRACSTVFGGE